KRILRDAENRRYGVYGERNVRDFHNQQNQKQRCGIEFPAAAHEEVFAFVIERETQVLAGKAENEAFLRVDFFLFDEQHVNSGVNNERAKHIQDPGKPLNQLRAGQYHYAAHHERAQDAPFEHAVLKTLVNRKGAEDHQEKEQIIDAERFL